MKPIGIRNTDLVGTGIACKRTDGGQWECTPFRLCSECGKPMSAEYVAARPVARVCASCENDRFRAAVASVKGKSPTTRRQFERKIKGVAQAYWDSEAEAQGYTRWEIRAARLLIPVARLVRRLQEVLGSRFAA